MGQHADDIINGDVDEQTGEWLGGGDGYPRTRERGHYNTQEPRNADKYTQSTKYIRKELAILIKSTKKAFPNDVKSAIVNDCRQAINTKYGKGWREQI